MAVRGSEKSVPFLGLLGEVDPQFSRQRHTIAPGLLTLPLGLPPDSKESQCQSASRLGGSESLEGTMHVMVPLYTPH